MGAYLSQPVTERVSEDGEGNNLRFGASAMQGWRVSQEDAHNCVVKLDEGMSLFAVYDGHGGSEIAIYMAKHFPDVLKNTENYKKGLYKEALHEAFLKIDADIKTPEVLKEIQRIAKKENNEDNENNQPEYEDEEQVGKLYEEATMPLGRLVAKWYRRPSSEEDDRDNDENDQCRENFDKGEGCSSSKAIASSSFSISLSSCSSSNNKIKDEEKQNMEPSSSKSEPESLPSKVIEFVKEDKIEQETNTKEKEHEKEEIPVDNNRNNTEKEAPVQNGNGDISKDISSEGDSNEVVKNETPPQNETTPTKKKKGKTHPVPMLMQDIISPIKETKSPSRISDRIKENDIYNKFIQTAAKDEEDDDDEDEDGDDEAMMEAENNSDENSDSDSDGEFDDGDTSEEDDEEEDGEEEEDDDDDAADDKFLSDLQEPGFDSGCTANVALVKWNKDSFDIWVANAGDSRCVVSRDGEPIDMSYDHKPEDTEEAQRIVKAGGKVTMDGRVNGGLNLSRAIGDHSYKQNEAVPPEEQMISPVPDIKHIQLNPNSEEFVVIACDGIWNSMSSKEVIDFVQPKLKNLKDDEKLSSICEQLFDVCMAPDTAGDGTGCDNMTAVIFHPSLHTKANGAADISLKRKLCDDIIFDDDESKRLKTE